MRAYIGLLCFALLMAHGEETMAKTEKATFAAGCFWGVEKYFGKMPGVIATAVGYTGGTAKNPSYEDVCTGDTGHAEAVEIQYDPEKVKYEDLLELFWRMHDPTTANRQGLDIGTQYRSAIFFYTPAQELAANSSKEILEKSGIFYAPIVTEIFPAGPFYRAEDYHQKYLTKNPFGYCSHHLDAAKISQILHQRR